MRKIIALYVCLVILALITDTIQLSEVNTEVIGHSVEGRPIFLVHKGSGPRVLITAGHHGNEKIATHMVWHVLPKLKGFEFLIIPVVNPDGFAAHRRTNTNGVDLNRNYDFEWEKGYEANGSIGSMPFSEPETKAVQYIIEHYKPQEVQVASFKKKKSELEDKIEVIRGLDRARSGPVRLLDELALSTPERLWITGLTTTSGRLVLEGNSLDNGLVADFLRGLGASDYFANVDLLKTGRGSSVNGVRLVRFEISADLVTPAEDDEKADTAEMAGA